MTIHDFQTLTPDMQHKLVKRSGVFLLARTGARATAKLYQMNGFYVELFYNEKQSAVTRIASFEDTVKLTCYLPLINISELQGLLRN